MCVFGLSLLYVVIFVEDFCEGYTGLLRYLLFVGLVTVWTLMCFCSFMDHERKLYKRLLSLIGGMALGVVSLIGLSLLVVDIVVDKKMTYEGKFSLEEERYNGQLMGYLIRWKDDHSFFKNAHYITTAHYKLLQEYKTVRVVFWDNTGVVKAVEPIKFQNSVGSEK